MKRYASLSFVVICLSLVAVSCDLFKPDLKPGELVWKFKTGGRVEFSGPAISPDSTIYVGASDGWLYAVTYEGKLKWKYATAGAITTSPLVGPDGIVYVGSRDSGFYALHPNGKLAWRYAADGEVTGAAAITIDGRLYFGCGGGFVHCLAADGTRMWRFPAGGAVGPVSIGPDGTIYAMTSNQGSGTNAIKPDGTSKWSQNYLGTCAPAVASDKVAYCGKDVLMAFGADGTPAWQAPFLVSSSPVIGPDGTIYFGSGSTVRAVSPDGSLKWTYSAGSGARCTPAVADDGTVYAGLDDGSLSALDRDGAVVWTFLAGDAIRSAPVIDDDGVVYFGSSDSLLYAVKGAAGPTNSQWPMLGHDARRSGRYTGP